MSSLANIDNSQKAQQIVAINDNAALMGAVARAASDPTVDVEKMERLFLFQQ